MPRSARRRGSSCFVLVSSLFDPNRSKSMHANPSERLGRKPGGSNDDALIDLPCVRCCLGHACPRARRLARLLWAGHHEFVGQSPCPVDSQLASAVCVLALEIPTLPGFDRSPGSLSFNPRHLPCTLGVCPRNEALHDSGSSALLSGLLAPPLYASPHHSASAVGTRSKLPPAAPWMAMRVSHMSGCVEVDDRQRTEATGVAVGACSRSSNHHAEYAVARTGARSCLSSGASLAHHLLTQCTIV